MDDSAAVSEFLDERPELESALLAVLEVDDANEHWTFDEVPVDSGAFGELVSRGFVEESDEGYRLEDAETVRAVVKGEEVAVRGESPNRFEVVSGKVLAALVGVDRRLAGALAGVICILVAARAYVFQSVFRDGRVVLSGNDPYYYRYWVERALAQSGGQLDPSILTALPDSVKTGEPLLITVLWALSTLLGGGSGATGQVLAWYPVVAAVASALVLYLLTTALTDDSRVGLAAVVLLAITPGHALRTSLGFADHHAFDYLWLAMTAYALVALASRRRAGGDRRRRAFAVLLGLSVTGQVLAWDASPILLTPVGLYVWIGVLLDVRDGRLPVTEHAPVIVGLGLAAALVVAAHMALGWHSSVVAFAPALLLFGVVVVVAAGEIATRRDVSATTLAATDGVAALAGLLIFRTLFGGFWDDLLEGIGTLTTRQSIVETQSLLSGDAFGWMLLFGFVLVLAVPYLGWGIFRGARGENRWLVASVYGWYFLALGTFQVRFAGQLALFAAVFAGLGFVHLAALVDITLYPVPFEADAEPVTTVTLPDGRTVANIALLFLLVGSLSFVQVPVKTNQITTDGDAYRTATWIAGTADDRNLAQSERYVFSQWGQNRMYNYFVNGESRSYEYAQRLFSDFATSTNGTWWYQRLRSKVGFVVLSDAALGPGTLHHQIYEAYGSRTDWMQGLSHYRVVHAPEESTRKVAVLVPGATITGPGSAASQQPVVSTSIDVGGRNATYSRVVTERHGVYVLTVPYPGNYTVGDETVTVTEADVERGVTHETFDGPGAAWWSFDEGSGTRAYDRWNGSHMRLEGTNWTDGGVSFESRDAFGSANAAEELSVEADESLTIQMTISGNLSQSNEEFPTVLMAQGSGQIGLWARTGPGDFGGRITDDKGDSVKFFGINEIDFEDPTNITVILDRNTNRLTIYRDGSLVGRRNAAALGAITLKNPLTVGASEQGIRQAPVFVYDLRVHRSVQSPDINETG